MGRNGWRHRQPGELSRQLDQKAEKIESRIVRLQEEAAEATKEEDAEALREVQAMLAKSEEELLKVKNEKKKLRGGLVGAFFAGSAANDWGWHCDYGGGDGAGFSRCCVEVPRGDELCVPTMTVMVWAWMHN
ncbi:hypothetical protein FA13DRAFT_1798813 [Coprinellus micaceus]|uniref:Uncharacterized protein n=1 Tax=Coprinellus micaceus TaxID=71717 RepID=A0A4Y7SKV2_COPMI|nr:hypothetical protein FA13DRAFT_1798813 [Coprinellus micaceus]